MEIHEQSFRFTNVTSREAELEQIDYIVDLFDDEESIPKQDKIEDLFLKAYPKDEEFQYKVIRLADAAKIVTLDGYDDELEIEDHFSFEEGEIVELYTNDEEPFEECENMLLVIKDKDGNLLARYYIEGEFSSENIENEEQLADAIKKLTGLDPKAKNVYAAQVN